MNETIFFLGFTFGFFVAAAMVFGLVVFVRNEERK